MPKYVYPAVFTPEKEGYSIRFPDLEGCLTSASDLESGIESASDALCLMLYDMEEAGEGIPSPSSVREVETSEDEFVSLISCDTLAYRKYFDKRAVKKTLTIPAWLNTIAERNGVNFSLALQNALMRELNIR